MAIEAQRGCGYRKVGGSYLVGRGLAAPCCKMPIKLHICPSCCQGIKQTRGHAWIDPRLWLSGDCFTSQVCPAANPDQMGEKVLLLWIGEQFYPTAEAFADEANRLGVSRRIRTVPRGFEVGKTWVFLAHPKVIQSDSGEWLPGIFRIFKPNAIERIVTRTQSQDAELMADLAKQKLTPVVVPDDDPDHQESPLKAHRRQPPRKYIGLLH